MRTFPRLAVVALFSLVPAALFAAEAPKPAVPAAPKPAAAAKEDEMGVVDGVEIARPNGGFLGVKTDGSTLSVTFYNKKKKKTAADVARIAVRWHDTKPRRAVLMPASPETFVSPSVFKPPFRYTAIIVLLRDDDQESETYSFNLNSL